MVSTPPLYGHPPLLYYSPLYTRKILPPPFRPAGKFCHPPHCSGGGAHYVVLNVFQHQATLQGHEGSFKSSFLQKSFLQDGFVGFVFDHFQLVQLRIFQFFSDSKNILNSLLFIAGPQKSCLFLLKFQDNITYIITPKENHFRSILWGGWAGDGFCLEECTHVLQYHNQFSFDGWDSSRQTVLSVPKTVSQQVGPSVFKLTPSNKVSPCAVVFKFKHAIDLNGFSVT